MTDAADFLQWLGATLTPFAWATHIPLGLAIQLLVAIPLARLKVANAWWIGAAVSIGFWWGRKKFEYEFALKAAAHLDSVGPFWYLGWIPFEWSWRRQAEFWAPAAANLLLAYWLRRRGR